MLFIVRTTYAQRTRGNKHFHQQAALLHEALKLILINNLKILLYEKINLLIFRSYPVYGECTG